MSRTNEGLREGLCPTLRPNRLGVPQVRFACSFASIFGVAARIARACKPTGLMGSKRPAEHIVIRPLHYDQRRPSLRTQLAPHDPPFAELRSLTPRPKRSSKVCQGAHTKNEPARPLTRTWRNFGSAPENSAAHRPLPWKIKPADHPLQWRECTPRPRCTRRHPYRLPPHRPPATRPSDVANPPSRER